MKDAYDCCYVSGELGYENCECVPMPHRSIACVNTYTGSDLSYCDICMNNCKNCFGSIGLQHKEYCILNKQYSKEEYEALIPKIIEHMRGNGEWGEFFPIKYSPFPYNVTEACDNYPLSKEDCIKAGYRWREKDKRDYQPQSYQIPDDIKDIANKITDEILACAGCGKNYKIIPQELYFYRNAGLPVPRKCFDCRHKDRLKLKNPRVLYDRRCDKCGCDIRTTYPPPSVPARAGDSPWIVYCEKDYLESLV